LPISQIRDDVPSKLGRYNVPLEVLDVRLRGSRRFSDCEEQPARSPLFRNVQVLVVVTIWR